MLHKTHSEEKNESTFLKKIPEPQMLHIHVAIWKELLLYRGQRKVSIKFLLWDALLKPVLPFEQGYNFQCQGM